MTFRAGAIKKSDGIVGEIEGIRNNTGKASGTLADASLSVFDKMIILKKWSWMRGGLITAVFVVVALTYLFLGMTDNTTYEHHSWSGPIICVHTSSSVFEYAVSGTLLLVFSFGICLPAYILRWWTLMIFVLFVVMWFQLSMTLAAWASC